MTALPDWGIVSDAELASAAAGGDRRAFAGIYDRYADRLHDFCAGMLRDRDAAADCVQDTFCAAATRLPQLREADKLRPWLYAIARNECLRCIRARGRERVYDDVPEAESADPSPDTMAARGELADLIAEAAGGLSDRDRSVLELAYRHGLDGTELAEALGVSASSAKKMTQRLRETIERSLGALLVSRRVKANPDACPELGEILDGWDGQFTVLMRKRIARHIESCPVCDEERRRLVSPAALLGAVPVFIPAPAWLRDRTLDHAQLAASTAPNGADSSSAPTQKSDAATEDTATAALSSQTVDADKASRRNLVPAVLAAIALIAVLGLSILWLHQHNARVAPADVTKPVPPPTSQAPRVVAPLTVSPPSVAPSQQPITTTVPALTSTPPIQSAPVTTTVAPQPPPPPPGPSSGTSTAPVFTPTPRPPRPPVQQPPSSNPPGTPAPPKPKPPTHGPITGIPPTATITTTTAPPGPIIY
ncbi:MAG TPA: sigma-70 family RNA polymerase sigma factor [Mycobacterium sp.]|nr:sigma-70 family RNA polymerase sigma factor [Mycobacterium sp.]